MSRSHKGSKGPGYDYWTRRAGNNGMQGYGPDVKDRTHRLERIEGKAQCRLPELEESQMEIKPETIEGFVDYGVRCRLCHHLYIITLHAEDFHKWLRHEGLVQNLFPYLSPDERELLISQTCGNCFDYITRE